jgi:hypothetical protein
VAAIHYYRFPPLNRLRAEGTSTVATGRTLSMHKPGIVLGIARLTKTVELAPWL